MATSATPNFKVELPTENSLVLPREPSPVPSIDSDDESFVVLAQSFDVDISSIKNEVDECDNAECSVLEEAKMLIKQEIENSNMQLLQQQMPKPEATANTSIAFSTELSPEEIQKKVELLIEENKSLKETIMENNKSIKTQCAKITEWQADVQRMYDTHKVKFSEAKNLITKLKTENAQLKLDLEKSDEIKRLQEEELLQLKNAKKQVTEVGISNEENKELKMAHEKINELEMSLNNMTLTNMRIIEENRKLKDAIPGEQSVIDYQKLLVEKDTIIDELKDKLGKQKLCSTEIEKTLNLEIINLKSHIQMMDNNQEKNGNQLAEELARVKQQLMNSQLSLMGLQENRNSLTRQLEEKEQEIEKLTKAVEELDEIKEQAFLLQNQLDTYKEDFEAERQAKETIKAEKEDLAADLSNLQRRNHQLQEEIELCRSQGFEVINMRRRQSSTASPPTAPEEKFPPLSGYRCPICNVKFLSLRVLEGHLEHCLGEPTWM